MTGGDSAEFAGKSTVHALGKVDYASRFQFLREAAFAIGVSRDRRTEPLERWLTSWNVSQPSRRHPASGGPSACVGCGSRRRSRRNSGRFGLLRLGETDVAVNLVTSLMPDLPPASRPGAVWLRLLDRGPRASPPVEDPDGPLARYQIATRRARLPGPACAPRRPHTSGRRDGRASCRARDSRRFTPRPRS